MSDTENNNQKIVIIGLDGADWRLFDKMIDKGFLPNIKRLKEGGCYGKLRTTFPPVTAPAWTSFATGKNPGQHGCFDFVLPENDINKYRPISASSIKSDTFYEILDRAGKKNILINLPVSYPPRIDQTVITSLLTRGDQFVYPAELIDEIPEFKNYKLAPDATKEKNVHQNIEDIREIEKVRFQCAQKLFKKSWDLFFILFSGTDWIQHAKYHDLITKDLNENLQAVKIYQEIDQYLGWFIDNLPKDTNLIVMSDHGFNALKGVFFVNQWLAQEKYLKFEAKNKQHIDFGKISEGRKEASKKGINFYLTSITKFLWRYPKLFGLTKKIYDKIKKFLPIYVQQDYGFDQTKTTAYSVSNCIYINRQARFTNGVVKDKEQYQRIKRELIEKLSKIQDKKTGQPVFDYVLDAHQVYRGNEVPNGPDIIVYSSTYLVKSIPGPLWLEGKFQYHSLDGIFMAYGTQISSNKEIEEKRIVDIMPTAFKLMGVEIPTDLDGVIIKEVFNE